MIEQEENNAGYTATSCGRVGRSGNARFHTFRLVLTDGPTDGRTDKASYRVACPQLKSSHESARFHSYYIYADACSLKGSQIRRLIKRQIFNSQ